MLRSYLLLETTLFLMITLYYTLLHNGQRLMLQEELSELEMNLEQNVKNIENRNKIQNIVK